MILNQSQQHQALFSIITICLNDKQGLLRTHRSIFEQTFSDFEWIVIDGASRDGTQQYLEQLHAGECRWMSEPDKGLYDAMNKGIEKASGMYLLFLNSGDEFAASDVLQKVSGKLSSDRMPDFIYGDSLERGTDGSLAYKPARNHKYLWYGMFTHHQAMFYNRSLVGQHRYLLSYPIGADYGFTAALISGGASIEYLSNAICIFEHGGLSGKNIKQGRKDQYFIRRRILHYPVVVCAMIWLLHVIGRSVKKITPSLHQAIRYSRKTWI